MGQIPIAGPRQGSAWRSAKSYFSSSGLQTHHKSQVKGEEWQFWNCFLSEGISKPLLFPRSTKEEITDVLFFSEPLVVPSTNLSRVLFCSFSLQSLFNISLPWKYLHLPAQHQSPILSQVKPPEQSADWPHPWLWERGHESMAPTRVRITNILTPNREACQFCITRRAKNSS